MKNIENFKTWLESSLDDPEASDMTLGSFLNRGNWNLPVLSDYFEEHGLPGQHLLRWAQWMTADLKSFNDMVASGKITLNGIQREWDAFLAAVPNIWIYRQNRWSTPTNYTSFSSGHNTPDSLHISIRVRNTKGPEAGHDNDETTQAMTHDWVIRIAGPITEPMLSYDPPSSMQKGRGQSDPSELPPLVRAAALLYYIRGLLWLGVVQAMPDRYGIPPGSYSIIFTNALAVLRNGKWATVAHDTGGRGQVDVVLANPQVTAAASIQVNLSTGEISNHGVTLPVPNDTSDAPRSVSTRLATSARRSNGLSTIFFSNKDIQKAISSRGGQLKQTIQYLLAKRGASQDIRTILINKDDIDILGDHQ